MALRSTFRPEAARGLNVRYELRLGKIVLHARVANGRLTVAEGPLADADLVIEAGPGIKAVLAGEVSPSQAIDGGILRVTGDPALLERFAELFQIPPRPGT